MCRPLSVRNMYQMIIVLYGVSVSAIVLEDRVCKMIDVICMHFQKKTLPTGELIQARILAQIV